MSKPAFRLSTRLMTDTDGKGAFGCLVSLVLLGAMVLVGLRMGPHYYSFKSLESDVGTEVSRAGAHYHNDEQLMSNLVTLGRKNEIRLKQENIKIERFAGKIIVTIRYSVPVDLVFLDHTIDFEVKSSSIVGTL